jgi:hypothetical protein
MIIVKFHIVNICSETQHAIPDLNYLNIASPKHDLMVQQETELISSAWNWQCNIHAYCLEGELVTRLNPVSLWFTVSIIELVWCILNNTAESIFTHQHVQAITCVIFTAYTSINFNANYY